MKLTWIEIIAIWVGVAALTLVSVLLSEPGNPQVEAWFGAILAGSIATVSLIQLFKSQVEGFVRRLVYVGGGSYLILATATLYIWLRG